jgi:chromosome partitioning protein
MSAKLISIVNMKGGVGKSTTTMMLAEALAAEHKRRVLVIDFDPQTNVSIMLAGYERWNDARADEKTLDVYFDYTEGKWKGGKFRTFVLQNVSDVEGGETVDVAPASPELRYTEREMIAKMVVSGFYLDAVEKRIRDRLLDQAIYTIRDEYDFILVDCPPGISMSAEAAIMASDFVIVPTIPDIVSKLGLQAFCKRSLNRMRGSRVADNPRERLLLLATKFEPDNALHQNELEVLRDFARDGSWRVLDTVVEQTRGIGQAAERLEPEDGTRSLHRKYGEGAATVSKLAAEVLEITIGAEMVR